MIKIIRAAHEHIDAVYSLICDLENCAPDKASFAKIYLENLTNNNVLYFLAAEDENIAGFASLHIQSLLHHCAKIGEIQEIIVSESMRNQGVGAMLIRATRDAAALENCQTLEVCCNLKRESSHRFYLNQGFLKSHYKFTQRL